MDDPDIRHLGCARQDIVEHGRCERLALRVKGHGFIETRSDALGGAASYLAIDNHWIDEHATVFNNDIVKNLHETGPGVQRDDCCVRRVTERSAIAPRAITCRYFETAGIDVGRKILRL